MPISVSKSPSKLVTFAVSSVEKTSTNSHSYMALKTGRASSTSSGRAARSASSTTSASSVAAGSLVSSAISDIALSGLSRDSVSIDAPNGVVDLLKERSLSSLRPEIVSMFSFLAAYTKNTDSTVAGAMLDLMLYARQLRIEDIQTLVSEMESDSTLSAGVDSLKKEYEDIIDSLGDKLDLMGQIVAQINGIKKVLDLLDNQDDIQTTIETIRSSRDSSPPKGQSKSISDILTTYLQFSATNASEFSNTRFMAQVLQDLKESLTTFSPQLLSGFDSDRQDDADPVNINSQTSTGEDFTFTLASVSSGTPNNQSGNSLSPGAISRNNNRFDPTSYSDFENFQNSLPSDEEEKIKVLLASMSRELRMSAGISRMENGSLDDAYGVDNGSLLKSIFGNIGEKITDSVAEEGTLASILRFEDDEGNVVLPFESRIVIDPERDVNFTPGSVFLADAILRGSDKFSTQPAKSYALSTSSAVKNGTSAIKKLMSFDDADKHLYFDTVFHDILSMVADSIDSLITDETVTEEQALGIALLSAASTDSRLKRLLYQYVLGLRAGDYSSASTSDPSDDTGVDIGGGNTGEFPGSAGGLDPFGSSAIGAASATGGSGRRTIGANPKITRSAVTSVDSVEFKGGTTVAVLATSNVPSTIETRIQSLFKPSKSSKASALISGLSSSSSSTNAYKIVSLKSGTITDILDKGTKNEKFILSLMADHADYLLRESFVVAGLDIDKSIINGSKNESGYTRFNQLSDDTLMLLLFEIVTAIVSRYVDVSFSAAASDGSVSVKINRKGVSRIRDKMLRLSGRSSEAVTAGSSTISAASDSLSIASLQQLSETFLTEDVLIRDLSDLLSAVSQTISFGIFSADAFFNSSSSSSTGAALADLISTDIGETLVENLSDMQSILAQQVYQTLMVTTDPSLLPDDYVFTDTEITALKSMLNEPEYVAPASNNLRLMSVGIPAGLLTALQNPTFTVGTDTSLESGETDLVTIKIYRLDPEFEDLVFYPRSFVFDMSRFAVHTSELEAGASFEEALQSFGLRNVSSEEGIVSDDTLETLQESGEYSSLSSNEIEDLFKNHVISELLRRYIKIMTGMDLGEHVFLSDESLVNVNMSEQAQSFLDLFLNLDSSTTTSCISRTASTSAGSAALADTVSVGAILSSVDPAVSGLLAATSSRFSGAGAARGLGASSGTGCSEDTESDSDSDESEDALSNAEALAETEADLYGRFKRLLTTLLISKESQEAKTLIPKMFERVFTVPVDPDDFEIDIDSTKSTRAGKRLLQSNTFKSCLVTSDDESETRYYLKSRDTEFIEYFAVVALGADL